MQALTTDVCKMDESADFWMKFFTAAGVPQTTISNYARAFIENRIQTDMLSELTTEYLRDMNITAIGDVIAILRHAKRVSAQKAEELLFVRQKAQKDSSAQQPDIKLESYGRKVYVDKDVDKPKTVFERFKRIDEDADLPGVRKSSSVSKRLDVPLLQRLNPKHVFERLGDKLAHNNKNATLPSLQKLSQRDDKQSSVKTITTQQQTFLKLPIRPILKNGTTPVRIAPSSTITSTTKSQITMAMPAQTQKVLLVKKVPLKPPADDKYADKMYDDDDDYSDENYDDDDSYDDNDSMQMDVEMDEQHVDSTQNTKFVKFAPTAEVHEISTVSSSTSGVSTARIKPFPRGPRLHIKNRLHSTKKSYNFKVKQNKSNKRDQFSSLGGTMASDAAGWHDKLPVHARLGEVFNIEIELDDKKNKIKKSTAAPEGRKARASSTSSSSVFDRLGR